MKKHEIVEELDKLKLKIMLEDGFKTKDEIEYDEWIDDMLLKNKSFKPWEIVHGNRKYATYKTVFHAVYDLLHKRFGDQYDWHEHQPMIMEIVKQSVLMTMFYLEKVKEPNV